MTTQVRPAHSSHELNIDQSSIYRLHGGLRLVGGAELDHRAPDVRFDGLAAHMQDGGRVVRSLAHSSPFQDLLLPVRQSRRMLVGEMLGPCARLDIGGMQVDNLLREIQKQDMQLYAVVLEVGEERVDLVLPEQRADAGVTAPQCVVV